MKTILVPTDLSSLADSALHVAADIARTYDAEILLVHYIPFSIARANTAEGAMAMVSYLDAREDSAVATLQEIADNPMYKDITITPIACRDEGSVYEAMTERHADLIVLATHGTSGWDELLFGSNAEHIVRYAHCPVLVIKKPIAHFAPKNPVAAVDMDEVLKANWPAYPFDADGNSLKEFVYVSTPNDPIPDRGVHEWMQELAQKNGITNYELHVRHARTVESGILNYANDRNRQTGPADLLVLFTHGYTGLRHLLQGSMAEDILNHAPLPVLILRINDRQPVN